MKKALEALNTLTLIAATVALFMIASRMKTESQTAETLKAVQADISLIGAYINWSVPVVDYQIQKDTFSLNGKEAYPKWKQAFEMMKKK